MAFRRFLFIPSVVRSSLVDNDGYIEFCSFAETLRSMGKAVFWYVVVPKWVKDGLKPLKNVQYIYFDSVRDVRINQTVGFPAFEIARDFARRGGRLVIDGVLTNCVGFAAYLKYILSDPQVKVKVPVFLRDHGHTTDIFKDHYVDWFVLASNYLCSHVAVRSMTERLLLATFLKKYSSPSSSRIFIDQLVEWPPGYITKEAPREDKRGEQAVLFCGGEFDFPRAKKHELAIAQGLFVSGNVSVVLTSRSPQHIVEECLPKGDRSFLRLFRTGISRDEYDTSLLSGDMFVSVLPERFTIEAEEEIRRLLFGQVGVFPYSGVAKEKLGKDYPFYYNYSNFNEAKTMASWVADNIDEARKEIADHVSRIREQSDMITTSMTMWNEITREVDSRYTTHMPRSGNFTKRRPIILTIYDIASKLGERFAFDVIVDILEEHITWLKPWNRKGTLKTYGEATANLPTMFDLREMLDNLGWGDVCDSPDIFFERTKEPIAGILEHL